MTMERNVGEVFRFNGIRLKVVETPFCHGCFFRNQAPCLDKQHIEVTGHCEALLRIDNKSVSFIKVE